MYLVATLKNLCSEQKFLRFLLPWICYCVSYFRNLKGVGDGTFRTFFITNFLKISYVNEITNVHLLFIDKIIGNQLVTFDWVMWLCHLDKFNVTVIDFCLTALLVLSQTKYERLTSNVPVENLLVSVFQYIKESLNLGNEKINKVIKEYSLDKRTQMRLSSDK